MKKSVAGILVTAMLTTNAFAADINFDTKAVFDSSELLLTVKGKAETGDNINLVVQPYEIESGKLTVDEANGEKAIFNMTTADKNGDYSVSMGLPEIWNDGIYKVLAYQGENKTESWFVYTDIANEELAKINSSDATALKAELVNLGIDSAFIDKYGAALSSILVSARPTSGYTKEEFLTELTAGIGICMMKNGDLTINELVERFSEALKVENSEFESLTPEAKSEAERLVKQLNATGDLSQFFSDCLLIAKVNKAESVEALQTLVVDNSGKLGINLSRYNALSTVYQKAQVFEKIIGKSYTTFEEIKNSFDAAIPAGAVIIPGGSGGSSSGGGGGGGSSSGSYGGAYSTDAPVKEAGFSDMDGHWATDAVKNLVAKNIINGFPDGRFMPEQSVTRAEFSKMICLAKNISLNNSDVAFSDVADSEWYSVYVKALAGNKIVNGFADGSFRPDSKISRQDAAVIVWRIIENSNTESKTIFSDEAEISDYAKDAVQKLGGLGIINGYNGYFSPNNNITRAEAAKIINSILNLGK